MHVDDEALGPRRDIYNEILDKQLQAIDDQVWDEIEEIVPELKKHPRNFAVFMGFALFLDDMLPNESS